MSKFLSEKFSSLSPYVPGEQPKDMQYVKLNTNESPFPPSQAVINAVKEEAGKLQLYSDPDLTELLKSLAEVYGVDTKNVIATNGSDEVLNFAFMAYTDKAHPAVFPNITYGFYSVFAKLHNSPFIEIPLKEDFSIDYKDYLGLNKTIFIANPNAPTGLTLSLDEIREILRSNPDNVVVIDEAYVDFGGESAVPLIKEYDNLLVTGTFSKSRSLAGARLGFGFASEKIIEDLNTIRFSTNPYNVNRMTLAAGVASLKEDSYNKKNAEKIIATRARVKSELEALGFTVLDSKANFLFAKSPGVSGKSLYLGLKEKGVLVRHFDKEIIGDFLRITIGTDAQMDTFLSVLKELL
ncbi:MAG: histidinol-phosphate transaminase [Ruminococcus sp.]|nr:histidinol-phosphate transaminase [Ruminococcus sp.]